MSKNPVLQHSNQSGGQHPAGSLLEEVKEQDMTQVSGGSGIFSRYLARRAGLGSHGRVCTLSAECNGTRSCAGG